MQELEAELQRNPAMQESLSRISRNTLQQAKNALDDAAGEDDQLQRQIERADPQFQAQKHQLIDDLKRLTQEAANVGNTLVAQANSAANQGKIPESGKKLADTQQQLREAQASANQLNDNTLLAEIREAAVDISEKVRDSAEKLAEARRETAEAEKTEIHADDKARAAAQEAFENARKNFHNQRIKSTQDVSKQAADARRRATEAAQQAEKALGNAQRHTEQAQAKADKKPQDQGLINALNQAKAGQQAAQEKVDTAKQNVDAATQVSREADEAAKAMQQRQLAPLASPNPAAELAHEYTQEAAGIVEDLAKRSHELADSVNWADQLKPPAAPLAEAGQRQTEVQRDVREAGQDVARAARHERRLKNEDPIESLENAAEVIMQVAANEVQQALEQLSGAEEAAKEAAIADAADGGQPEQESAPKPAERNATAARQAVQVSEEAITAQADQLGQILDAADQAADAAQASAAVEQDSGSEQGEPGQDPGGQDTAGQNTAGNNTGQGAGQATRQSPAELERAGLLARTLDELDQRLATAEGPQTPAATGPLLNLAQAARARNAALAAARTPQSSNSSANALDSLGQPASTGELGRGFAVKPINRDDGKEWGMLRGNAAEDTVQGTREAVAAEYRESVEAYFRVLAERARQKQ